MMTVDAFRESLSEAQPPAAAGPPLQALWWAAKGDWHRAHKVCQDHEDRDDVNWVHAHLHRQEGDLRNAQGWYNRAGKTMPANELQTEWRALAAQFLSQA
jgi:hypothetical protein